MKTIARAVLLVALFAGGLLFAHDRRASLLYGDPSPVNGSHLKYVADGTACTTCHPGAITSRQAQDSLLPPAPQPAPRSPEPVLRNPPPVLRNPTPVLQGRQLRFDHAAHAQKGIPCARCHTSPAAIDAGLLPEMADCQRCHDSQRLPQHAASRCQTCHLAERDGTLVTTLATGKLIPMTGDVAHTASFRTQHGRVAGPRGKTCESCHRQDFCQTCHNGAVKPLDFHGNDYLTRHPIDARRAELRCQSCHRAQSFCLSCHERAGVGGGLPGSGFQPGTGNPFHPSGFASDHGPQARKNLRTCASCHREDSCMDCHSTVPGSKQQTSPHGKDWARSLRCQSLLEKNPRVCARCHDDATCGH